MTVTTGGGTLKSRVMYVELKTHEGGHDDNGPAWIGRVTFSKSGRTIYYRGKRLQRSTQCCCGNYFDTDTGDEYWVSGPKKKGGDRYPWAHAPIEIDEDVREEYWTEIRNQPDRADETSA